MTAEEKLEVMRSGKWHYGMDPDIGEALRPARRVWGVSMRRPE